MSFVYLSGPITGCSYGGATDWRGYVKSQLKKYNIPSLSPLRAKDYLSKEQSISKSYEV